MPTKGKYSDADVEHGTYTDADVAPSGQVTVSAAPAKWSLPWLKSEALTLRDKAVNALPAVGGAVGGLIGGAAGSESGPGAIIPATAGAAAGGGLGEDVRQFMTEHFHPEDKKMTAKEAAKGIGKQAGLQGASELLPGLVAKVFRPASAIEKLSFVGNLGPREDIAPALSELQQTEKMAGNQVKTVGDYLNVIDQTKNRIGTEVGASLKIPVQTKVGKVPLGAMEADTTQVSDALTNLATKHPSEVQMNPQKLTRFKARALDYQKNQRSYAWLFDRRQVLNEELNRFYSLPTDGEKSTYLNLHPDFEADKAEADAIRDVIYPQMDKAAGKPAGYYADLQRKYGAITRVGNATQKNVEKLAAKGKVQRGAPLSERTSASTYLSEGGRPGFSLHRIHGIISPANPVKHLDSAAKSAFGHSALTKTGSALSSNVGREVLALPLHYLANPDAPVHPVLSPQSPVQ